MLRKGLKLFEIFQMPSWLPWTRVVPKLEGQNGHKRRDQHDRTNFEALPIDQSESSASCGRWPGGSRTGLWRTQTHRFCVSSSKSGRKGKGGGRTKRPRQNPGAQEQDEGAARQDALSHALRSFGFCDDEKRIGMRGYELECTSFVKSEARLSSARPKAAHKSVLTHCFCLHP